MSCSIADSENDVPSVNDSATMSDGANTEVKHLQVSAIQSYRLTQISKQSAQLFISPVSGT